MSTNHEYFHVEQREGVHLVTLDNPPYNAVFAEMLEPATQQIRELGHDPATHAIVLTGAGDDFTRGMDVKVAASLDAEGITRARAAINQVAAELHRLPCAFVCAVNGHTIGAGGIITLCADWVVAAEGDYKIGLPEAKAGLAFPPVPQAIIDHWLDPVWRRRLALTSQLFAPQDAIATGLVDEVVDADALIETALARAEELAAQPAFRDCKRQLRAKANAEIDAHLA
ncbi:enoyl-CoA hydratase/isomerase family protein [uncultured Erythrobacter sp.]|uniref:enoyl-CoA hydratase/isomerase family protein n=1 Tax=uncultured Erythrobacter sp. TaxID=263913 RepID=UPI00260EA5F6|nr:enoyl-CoA hydratase/isomerase family protein [uncultured Erythrobacter sp.]